MSSSSSSSSYVVYIFYNGEKFVGTEGMTFRGDSKTIRINRKISFIALKEKIHEKLRLSANQIISSVTCRYSVDNDKFYGGEICDDADVQCMIDVFEQSSRRIIEIYADIDVAGSSSSSRAQLFDLNIHALTMCDEEAEVGGGEEDVIEEEGDEGDEGDESDEMEYDNLLAGGSASDTDPDCDEVHHLSPTSINISAPTTQEVQG